MNVSIRHIAASLFLMILAPSAAFADCLGCNRTPPSGCHANSCNPTPPPQQPCVTCRTPQIVVPRPYVPVPNIVIAGASANASASAQASATSIAIATAQTGDVIVRSNVIGDLGVDVGVMAQAAAFGDASFTAESAQRERDVLISAICLDAQGNPHPASQTFGDRNVAEDYKGEIYRCVAGTHMRVTMDSRTFDCEAGEALWYEDGQATCRAQIAKRPCNERSLLRRYGPGEKVVRVRETATYERSTTGATLFGSQTGAAMQGGVGY